MIVALAGRRIDDPNAGDNRFPLEMKDVVYERILDFFRSNNVKILVSSAACGADLLAQKAARELEIERHIILPFRREKFRETSVTDRPGNWGKLFDEICDEAERKGNLIVLKDFEDNEDIAYSAVTTEIIKYAKKLQPKNEMILAVTVWEGKAKNEIDETDAFKKKAILSNISVKEIAIK